MIAILRAVLLLVVPCVAAPGQAPGLPGPDLPSADAPGGVAALLALLDGADRDAGFAALCRLAVSGYRPDVARRLLAIAVDAAGEESWREYAAMGLGNMHGMPQDERARVRAGLCDALAAEGAEVPDGVARLMVRLGDAASVRETLGGALQGAAYEVDVLAKLPDAASRQRLIAILAASPGRKAAPFGRRFAVARALVEHGDLLGVDVLVQMLERSAAPGFQHRHNVWTFLVRLTGARFLLLPAGTEADLDATAAAFRHWWGEHRDDFWLPPPGIAREPGTFGPGAREAVEAWRARAEAEMRGVAVRSRAEAWLHAPVLGALFPDHAFWTVHWWFDPVPGGAGTPLAARTTLALSGGKVAHELTNHGSYESFGALLRSAGVKLVEPAGARAVWAAFGALHGHSWRLREVRRAAPDTWWLVLEAGGRYELVTGDDGTVRSGRLRRGG